jgi:hypothetical protein
MAIRMTYPEIISQQNELIIIWLPPSLSNKVFAKFSPNQS